MRALGILRALGRLVSRYLRVAIGTVADAMPAPPHQLGTGRDPGIDEEEARRRTRWKIKMLEKRGKGGFR
jgi:hypothetical protein